jgi:urea transport system permease protein
MPDLWPLILGGLFIIIVLLLPKGLVGIPGQIRALLAGRRRQDEEPGPDSIEPASADQPATPA